MQLILNPINSGNLMAKKKQGNPNPKNQFKAGNQIGKLGGRPKLTPEQKQLAITTRTKLKTVLHQYIGLPKGELKKLLRDDSLSVGDAMLLKAFINALDSGSQQQIDWFLNHIMGKPKETSTIKVESDGDKTQIDLKKLSKEELIALKQIAEKSEGK